MAFKTKRTCKRQTTHFNHNQYESGINTPIASKSVEKMKSIFQAKRRHALNKNDPVRQGNKLRTYPRFKQKFTYEIYLDVDKNYRKRQIITQIRCSAHRLEIETGRYKVNGN